MDGISLLINNSTRRVLTQHHKSYVTSLRYCNKSSLSYKRFGDRQGILLLRQFSDKPPVGGKTSKEIPNEERTDIVLTPGQKVVAGTRLTFYLGAAAAALTCLYFTVRELMPTKMSPNTVFNNAHSIIQKNLDVTYRFGEPIKTFGRDHGGHREGRRNFIEHSEYTDKDDGSKRVRVRFNLEGPKGNAYVFAEVSSDMPSGEFVYLLVQDKRNGMVITVIDNRSMLAAKRMASGSKEGEEAFANLLSGGRSK
jgi:import inner membrane translocase subunit TIM21